MIVPMLHGLSCLTGLVQQDCSDVQPTDKRLRPGLLQDCSAVGVRKHPPVTMLHPAVGSDRYAISKAPVVAGVGSD